MLNKPHLLVSSVLLTAIAPSLLAQAPVVSPADRLELEGSSFTHLPLGRKDARMQTLHIDVPGGTVISGHAYRREAAGLYGAVANFATELEITLSMSPNLPTQAATAFAQNTGLNPVVVLPRTILAFPGTARPAVDPAPTFELVVPYQTPFVVPPTGGTLCVDVTIFGNSTATGADRNFSVYLDGHRNYPNGDARQPGYRYGTGCAVAGLTTPTTGGLSLWHRGNEMEIDLSVRDGIAETGPGLTRAWLTLGTAPAMQSWPLRSECPLFHSNDVWFVMPGTMDNHGDYDGSLAGLPVLPPGYRLWAQAGSAHLGSGALSFSNGITVRTQPAGPSPIPTCRIVNSNSGSATTGNVSYAVPVMLFF